jgi:hypothetical protein
MRRRDVYKEQTSQEPVKMVKAGECPKCGKHIGRGVGFHAKACKGLINDDIRNDAGSDSH